MDAYQFYRVAPEGMMLVTTGLDLPDYSLAGVERELAQALVDEANEICPYSKATRGNIDVVIKLVEQDRSRAQPVRS
jgi:hypothetical protein